MSKAEHNGLPTDGLGPKVSISCLCKLGLPTISHQLLMNVDSQGEISDDQHDCEVPKREPSAEA